MADCYSPGATEILWLCYYASMNKPSITFRTNGDNSFTMKVDYGNGKVYVHTNKKLKALQDLITARYGARNFV